MRFDLRTRIRLLVLLATAAIAGAAAVAAYGAVSIVRGTTAHQASAPPGSIPGIVDIYTKLGYQNAAAAGTGIVLTSSGEILTNNHVIRGSTAIQVTDLDNNRKYKARVVGYSLANDVAVLQLQNASGLKTASIGDSSSLRLGSGVTTYGNAGGAGGAPSVSTGQVTSLGRSITVSDDQGGSERLTGLIETDAALEPGDSGGPMVDSGGKIIGLDTAATSSFSFDTSSSRGYAIPINRATGLASQIVGGHASATVHIGPTAFLGISVQSQNDFFGQSTGNGLIIANVVSGSPTDKAGLEPGDVITHFGGKALTDPSSLTAIIVTKAPGDVVPVRIVDQYGSSHSVSVKLASGPPQ